MKNFVAAAGLVVVTACGSLSPSVGLYGNSSGVSGSVGVEGDRVAAGVTTSGDAYAAVDVVQTDNVDVSIGTGGVGVSVGSGPVQVGFGTGGWGIHI